MTKEPQPVVHPRAAATLKPCELYTDHGSARPSVTQGHHRYPEYLQRRLWGETRLDDLIWLCGTCHDNVHAWIYYLMGERRKPDPDPPARAKRLAEAVLGWFEQYEQTYQV